MILTLFIRYHFKKLAQAKYPYSSHSYPTPSSSAIKILVQLLVLQKAKFPIAINSTDSEGFFPRLAYLGGEILLREILQKVT